MTKDLVMIAGELGLARYDTEIREVVAMHARVPSAGAEIDSATAFLSLFISSPGELYGDNIEISLDEVNGLHRKYGSEWTKGQGYNIRDLSGKPIRVYYSGHSFIGWEPVNYPEE